MVITASTRDDYISSLIKQDNAKKQAAITDMKRSVDPRTQTISYSGADFSAIVFLPILHEQLQEEIKALQADREKIQNELEQSAGVWESYNTDILNQLSIATNAYEQYEYYLGEGDQVQANLWWTTYITAKTREREAIDNRSSSGGDVGYRQGLLKKIESFNNEIERLDILQKSSDAYIKPVKLFDIQTISISSHREKFPVRTLGRVHAKSYTRGPRSIAGSMIFTLFDRHALWELVQASSGFYSSGVGINGSDSGYPELSTVLVDQLPPFDITLLAANELGDISYAVLYGVEIVNDGRTISIQDIITENVMQFICRDFEDLRPLASRRMSLALGVEGKPRNATDIVSERLKEQQRRGIRLNPYV